MNFNTIGYAIAVAAALLAQGANAQTTAPDQKTRAEVKAETAAAIKKGELPKNTDSEGKGQDKAAPKSTTPRAEVKAETANAAKKGDMSKAGEGVAIKEAPTKSTTTRAELKGEVAAAKKRGEQPLEEGSMPPPATPAKK